LSCTIQNLGSQDIFVGPSDAVSVNNGLMIAKGFSQDIGLEDDAAVWGITASGSSSIRLAEYSA
jgi:hypothetical protein